MIDVGIFSALLGGLLTFLAPCTLPLIPAFLAFIGGTKEHVSSRFLIMKNALLFVGGFSLVFMAYGLLFGAAGKFFILHRALLSQIGGLVVIFFGLSMLELFSFPNIFQRGSFALPQWVRPGSSWGAFLLGFLFALGWSPCLGPILGTILVLSASTASAGYGAFLLFVYALGLALPFLFLAYCYGRSFTYVSIFMKHHGLIKKTGALLIIGIGVLLVIGQFGMLNTWATSLFGDFGFDTLVDYM